MCAVKKRVSQEAIPLRVNRCFIIREPDRAILLSRRSLQDSFNPGRWEVPGGKMNSAEVSEKALFRELKEEVGLTVELLTPLSCVESYRIKDGKYAGRAYEALFRVAKWKNGTVRLSHEHENCVWVSYQEMFDYDITNEVRKAAIVFKDLLT